MCLSANPPSLRGRVCPVALASTQCRRTTRRYAIYAFDGLQQLTQQLCETEYLIRAFRASCLFYARHAQDTVLQFYTGICQAATEILETLLHPSHRDPASVDAECATSRASGAPTETKRRVRKSRQRGTSNVRVAVLTLAGSFAALPVFGQRRGGASGHIEPTSILSGG